jgi:glucokinase
MKTILAADIGGTHSRIYLAEVTPQGLCDLHQASYFNRDFLDFTAVMQQFLSATNCQQINAACFAVAGPVIEQSVHMTNLPWQLNATALAAQFNINQVQIINDFAAQVFGLDQLNDNDFYTLQSGTINPRGSRALIGAGTGLGVALGIQTEPNQPWQCWPSQGGNTDFAPSNTEQMALWQFLHRDHTNVSNELLLSGAGIQRIFRFVLQQANTANTDENLQHWSAAQITHAAIQKNNPAAQHAMQLFVNIYGTVASNLALMSLPSGGLFITGGIAPKILPLMQDDNFMQGFLHNSRMQSILKTIPVRVVLNEQLGLLGAKHCASQMVINNIIDRQ